MVSTADIFVREHGRVGLESKGSQVWVSCAAEAFATAGRGLSALGERRTMAGCDVGAVARGSCSGAQTAMAVLASGTGSSLVRRVFSSAIGRFKCYA